MSFSRSYRPPPPPDHRSHHRDPYVSSSTATATATGIYHHSTADNDFSRKHRRFIANDGAVPDAPSSKRRRSAPVWDAVAAKNYRDAVASNAPSTSSSALSHMRSHAATEDTMFLSRDEIERCSPSRRDGIDLMRETHLRYSYCWYIQNLGMRLQLPQTTIGTAMVLCHRFYVRRSHAGNDRFLIATAALFLAAKSEETPCPLNSVLRASCEICNRQEFAFFPYLLHGDWFEQYRERVIEAEQIILTTLDFELTVEHPYDPLASVLNKLGLSQTLLLNIAWNLISEGLRSSLWLQFKPHHIAAGAAFVAAKFLNFDLASYQSIWREFETTPSILQDVMQQLMELFY
ncbi:cyclin-T1-5-like isoform X2 [Dioscorea cayenensis subsp. rotundata]|uniref:Cyclin-T1-5-like isoform X2 n=1 Tax=Dioscorea cayennensis subsp. rotundata TaxID=55577 RepID=A0AB40AGV5_DIOCR|nr:cyclin-T1-5-like isoform X2 [Dioscorea cayenensis subsp. rotundata]